MGFDAIPLPYSTMPVHCSTFRESFEFLPLGLCSNADPSPLGNTAPGNDCDGDSTSTRSLPVKAIRRSMIQQPGPMPISKSQYSVTSTKKKPGPSILGVFSVKEPSKQALREYEQVVKKQQQTSDKGRPSAVGLPMTSAAKMPGHVPKINSKWDGLPVGAQKNANDVKALSTVSLISKRARPSTSDSRASTLCSNVCDASMASNNRPASRFRMNLGSSSVPSVKQSANSTSTTSFNSRCLTPASTNDFQVGSALGGLPRDALVGDTLRQQACSSLTEPTVIDLSAEQTAAATVEILTNMSLGHQKVAKRLLRCSPEPNVKGGICETSWHHHDIPALPPEQQFDDQHVDSENSGRDILPFLPQDDIKCHGSKGFRESSRGRLFRKLRRKKQSTWN